MASPILWQKILALFTRADATDQALSSLESSLFDKIYPVGSIYISTSTTNPSVLFGGTWEAISAGKVLVQADSNHVLGNTGGNATITLTEAQLPAHTHNNTIAEAGGHSHSRGSMEIKGGYDNPSYTGICAWTGGGSQESGSLTITDSGYTPSGGGYGRFCSLKFTASKSWAGATNTVANHNHTITNASVGSGSAVNIEQPWLAVNMWKRTA